MQYNDPTHNRFFMSMSTYHSVFTSISDFKCSTLARNGKGYQRFRLRMPRKLKDVWYEDLRYKTHEFREKLERLFSDTLLRLFEVVAGLKPEQQVKMNFTNTEIIFHSRPYAMMKHQRKAGDLGALSCVFLTRESWQHPDSSNDFMQLIFRILRGSGGWRSQPPARRGGGRL